ncbi:hypothetical protein GCM10020367_67100 [Streptomyces sannanensis]|uniref:Uncharacterized protein n=1 Tax=Streptomyces sannanensis TaxID=285536 RepID=A0ABP6SM74_9ACTN
MRKAALAEPPGSVTTRAPRRRPVRVMAPADRLRLGRRRRRGGEPRGHVQARHHRGHGWRHPRAPEVTQLLDRIALTAAEGKQPAVRADQFVYVESKVANAGQSAAGDSMALAPEHTRQVWLSADGSRPGLVREAGLPTPRSTHQSSPKPMTPARPGPLSAPPRSSPWPQSTAPARLPRDDDVARQPCTAAALDPGPTGAGPLCGPPPD